MDGEQGAGRILRWHHQKEPPLPTVFLVCRIEIPGILARLSKAAASASVREIISCHTSF